MAVNPGSDPANPWKWTADDYLRRAISISLPWDSATRALGNATVVRDQDCLYGHLYIGVGPDGRPESSANAYAVPVGTHTVSSATLASNGLSTIDDVVVLQVTAGP